MNLKFIIGCAFLATAACYAQILDEPKPTAPYVAPVPENVQWTITIKSTEGAAANQEGSKHRLTQINSTKTGQLKRDVRVYEDGKSEERWFSGPLIIVPSADGQTARCIDFEEANRSEYGEAGNPIASPGFPGVGWVKLEYFDKVVTFNQIRCFHYVLSKRHNNPADEGKFSEAWIDVRNGFPVAYRAAGSLYLYRFEGNPIAPLVLPDSLGRSVKFAQRISDRRRELQNATN